MKYVINVQDLKPDEDKRSLRFNVKSRKNEVLRDTYFLIDPENSSSRNLKMGHTTIYPMYLLTSTIRPTRREISL